MSDRFEYLLKDSSQGILSAPGVGFSFDVGNVFVKVILSTFSQASAVLVSNLFVYNELSALSDTPSPQVVYYIEFLLYCC